MENLSDYFNCADTYKGCLDYYLKPWLRSGSELYSLKWRGLGPLNGQVARQQTVAEVIRKCGVQAIVETGTYRGVTTEWFASFGVPVWTVELNSRLYGYSSARLRHLPNVTVLNQSSPDSLRTLGLTVNMPKERVLFYLDAHWDADVPLQEELREIYSERWQSPIVMIDDFHVPGDSYNYLDRGPGKCLSERILGQYAGHPKWYPATPAYQETGVNTGWIILTSDRSMAQTFAEIKGLRTSDRTSV